MFNAVKYIKKLEAVGFEREQAEAQVQLVYEAMGDELASKSDLSEFQTAVTSEIAQFKAEMAEFKVEMAEFKAEMKNDMAEFKAEIKTEISGLRTEIYDIKAEIVYKLGALMLASTTATTAILGILIKF